MKIIDLDEKTPGYEGYSQIFKVGKRYYRTRDAEGYRSYLEEIDRKEFERLKKYKYRE